MELNRRELRAGDRALLAYGHWGRPLIVFPAERGNPWDWEQNGMIDAIGGLIEAGRVKVYAVDSFDDWTWADTSVPLEERARRHGAYEHWILDHVVPLVHEESGGATEILLTGTSMGAFHAANFALKRADLFPLAISMSGVYDVSQIGDWGERGDATYFNNPMDYVAHLDSGHLAWLRGRVNLLLVVGQGAWEDSTGARESTLRFAELLARKGIRHELDVWGHDVAHDWPAWRAQIAHHLPRFV
jgi:esterase/lipase superfamily enzyme